MINLFPQHWIHHELFLVHDIFISVIISEVILKYQYCTKLTKCISIKEIDVIELYGAF